MICWLRPNEEGGANEAVLAKIRGAIAEHGGEIVSQSKPARRQFSYPVKKQREGIWMTFEAKMPPGAVKTLPEAFRHESDILRIGLFGISGARPKAPSRSRRRVAAPIGAPVKSPEPKTVGEEKSEIKIEELDKKLKELLSA